LGRGCSPTRPLISFSSHCTGWNIEDNVRWQWWY
jgi:hypothetical protein